MAQQVLLERCILEEAGSEGEELIYCEEITGQDFLPHDDHQVQQDTWMEEHLEVTCLLANHPWVDWIHQGTWEHGHPVGDLLRVGYRQEGKTERRERQDTLARGPLWAVH